MTILHRYLMSTFARSWGVAFVFFAFTFLSLRLLRLARVIAQPGITLHDFLVICAFLIPTFIEFVAPLATYIAVAVSFVRLRLDGELIAIHAGAGSPAVFSRPLLAFGLGIAAFSFLSATLVRPWALNSLRTHLSTVVSSRPTSLLQSKVFTPLSPGIVLYVDQVDPGGRELRGVFFSDNRDRNRREVAVAARGTLLESPDGKQPILHLEQGTAYRLSSGSKEVETTRFDALEWRLPFDATSTGPGNTKPSEMTILQLVQTVRQSPASSQTSSPERLELSRRLVMPLTCLLFCFAGLTPLFRPRAGYGEVAFVGGISVTLYYLFSALGESLTLQNHIPAELGALLPLIVLSVFLCGRLILPTQVPRSSTHFAK